MTSKKTNHTDSLIVYNLFQLVAYSLMAFLIMRLKLFWTPHLCIFASFIANNNSSYSLIDYFFKFFYFLKNKWENSNTINEENIIYKKTLIALIIGSMCYRGISNLEQQHSIQGEYNDYTMETMMNWIKQNTHINDAFVGSMSIMANIKLSTNRPIINHPHYEDVKLRRKTNQIYSHLYGFRRVEELHSLLKSNFSANYLVMENHYCYSNPPGKPECAMAQIVHLNSSFEKKTSRQACDNLISGKDLNVAKYFKNVFNLKHIYIFKII